MKVLYVSHASRVVAYRDKLSALASRVRLHTVVRRDWGRDGWEAPDPRHPQIERHPTLFHGHLHLHVYAGLGRALDTFQPDLVHMDEEPYSMVTLQASAPCGSRGVPFVFFAWQNLEKRLPPPFGALRREVYRTARGGIAGSEGAARVLRRTGFDGPLSVIPQMGVDPDRFRPDEGARGRSREALGFSENAFVAGYVGGLIPEKGVDLLLDAARRLPNLHVAVVGGGPEAATLQAAARRLGLNGRAHFVGSVDSVDVPTWMAAFDVLVLPTRGSPGWTEQFGRVLMEAMSCGVPVVGTDAGEIPVVIGEAGCVVRRNDPAALAEVLDRLAGDPAARARLASAGTTRVHANYTQERIADATVAFYDSIRAQHAA